MSLPGDPESRQEVFHHPDFELPFPGAKGKAAAVRLHCALVIYFAACPQRAEAIFLRACPFLFT